MTETQKFHIGTILSITTNRLVSPDHIGGVYAITDYMLDASHFTHQLPAAGKTIRPQLLEAFPQFAAIEVPNTINSMETCLSWLETLYEEYGEWHEVEKFHGEYEHGNPLEDLLDMSPNARVIPVVVSE